MAAPVGMDVVDEMRMVLTDIIHRSENTGSFQIVSHRGRTYEVRKIAESGQHYHLITLKNGSLLEPSIRLSNIHFRYLTEHSIHLEELAGTEKCLRVFGEALHHPRSDIALIEKTENLAFDNSRKKYRLLLMDGVDGTVACRVYGSMRKTTPRLSSALVFESATRTLLRLNNLVAVRGAPGASMVGPADYFCNLEEIHKYLFTIDMQSTPLFSKTLITADVKVPERVLKEFDDSCVTAVQAKWIHGNEEDIKEKKSEYQMSEKSLKLSLFESLGLLEIDAEFIELKYFDAKDVDLSSFKARLVKNSIPFQITNDKLPSKDYYRMISYLYEPGYASWQTHFLEKHPFSQSITPLNSDCRGFVTLARFNVDKPNILEIIAVRIDYDYTLIIEQGCIHGDATLNGLFMMGMTSDHTSMRAADTVFLKNPTTKDNVRMVMTGHEVQDEIISTDFSHMAPAPFVIYKDASNSNRAAYKAQTKGKKFIFNPQSREYFKY